jgi:hypothetical protein
MRDILNITAGAMLVIAAGLLAAITCRKCVDKAPPAELS